MPDLALVTTEGPLRVFELLHEAQPVLLNLGHPGELDITPWADRVKLIDASYDGRDPPGSKTSTRGALTDLSTVSAMVPAMSNLRVSAA